MTMDTTYFPPRFVADLASVPEEWRLDYQPYRDGGQSFKLAEKTWAMVERAKSDIKHLEKEIATLKQKHEQTIAREAAATKAERVNTGLRAAFKAAGVKTGLLAGAVAILSETNRFEVEPGYEDGEHVVMVERGGHLYSVDYAVEEFLGSEDGAPYLSKPRAPENDGRFASIIAGLKQAR